MNYLEKTDQNEKRQTRFLRNDNWTKKKYLTELEAKEAYSIINSRLNTINVEDNYNNSEINTKCELCDSDDTTEH